MNKLANFKQSQTRAWIWFCIIALSAFGALLALATGIWLSMVNSLLIAGGAYWIDKLEKKVTLNNFRTQIADPLIFSELIKVHNQGISDTILAAIETRRPGVLTPEDVVYIKEMVALAPVLGLNEAVSIFEEPK